MFFKKYANFLFLLCALFSTVYFLPASAAEIQAFTEDELAIEADTDAAIYIEQYKDTLSKTELTTLERAHKVILQKLRQVGYLKSIVQRYGKTAILAGIATSITMDTTIPALLLYCKLPILAAVAPLTPWSVMGASGIISWQMARERNEIRKAVGTKDLKSLDQLRREILHFEGHDQIMEIAITAASDQISEADRIVIVKKLQTRTDASVISIADLETIIKASGPDGEHFLFLAKDSVHNSGLYTAKLVHFIADSETMSQALIDYFQTGPKNSSTVFSAYRASFQESTRTFSRYKREMQALQTFASDLLEAAKKTKDKDLIREAKAYKKEAQALLEEIQAAKKELTILEYSFLIRLNAEIGPYPNPEELELALLKHKEDNSALLTKLERYRFNLESPNWAQKMHEAAFDLRILEAVPCSALFEKLKNL